MKELLDQIAARFDVNPNEIMLEKILHGNREKQNVHKIRIREKSYLLKQHDNGIPLTGSEFAPYQIENFVLSTLYKGGCLVPQIELESEKHKALILSWCGDETLDSLVQSQSNRNLNPILHTAMTELCQIEGFFEENSAQFKPYIFQFDLKQDLHGLLRQGRKTIGYLEHLSKVPPTSTQIVQLDEAWNSIAKRLLNVQPTLGGLDYQAHNIVIDNQLPYFIDFASIGWDWQERRLVQYFNSIGAYQESSNFISLLNSELVDTYTKWVTEFREKCSVDDVTMRIDAHHVLFYLSVIHRILAAVAKPELHDSMILKEAWGNMQQRFKRAISLIIDEKLSDDLHTNQIRSMIAEFQSKVSMD